MNFHKEKEAEALRSSDLMFKAFPCLDNAPMVFCHLFIRCPQSSVECIVVNAPWQAGEGLDNLMINYFWTLNREYYTPKLAGGEEVKKTLPYIHNTAFLCNRV